MSNGDCIPLFAILTESSRPYPSLHSNPQGGLVLALRQHSTILRSVSSCLSLGIGANLNTIVLPVGFLVPQQSFRSCVSNLGPALPDCPMSSNLYDEGCHFPLDALDPAITMYIPARLGNDFASSHTPPHFSATCNFLAIFTIK